MAEGVLLSCPLHFDEITAAGHHQIEVYDGGPAGIEALAATMGDEIDTLVDVIEPYLLQTALVTRTRQGRRATKAAYEHLGLKWTPPKNGNGDDLFGAAGG